MSKKDKRLLRLCAIPAPKDFSWDELVSLMRGVNFKAHCQGGSHFTFEHATGFTFMMSRTHPSGILKSYQIKAAKDALRQVGVLEEDENGSV